MHTREESCMKIDKRKARGRESGTSDENRRAVGKTSCELTLWNYSPVVGTNQSNFKQFVPETGLRS